VVGSVLLQVCLQGKEAIIGFNLLRALQGLGAAAALAAGTAGLAQAYDGARRTRAFSFVGASFGVGLAFGLAVGLVAAELGLAQRAAQRSRCGIRCAAAGPAPYAGVPHPQRRSGWTCQVRCRSRWRWLC
jgi:MFS family permease